MLEQIKRLLGIRSGSSTAGQGRRQIDTSGAPRPEPVHITDADFETVVLQSDLPVVVDFWADWCGPCHAIAPAVEDLAANFDGKAVVAKLNVDENPRTPQQFGIMGIPTLIFFQDGKEVDRVVGVTSYEDLATRLQRLLADGSPAEE